MNKDVRTLVGMAWTIGFFMGIALATFFYA